MVIIVISQDNKIHEVKQFIKEGTSHYVWSDTWPGMHTVGKDCRWLEIKEKEWARVKYIQNNPDMTIEQIAKELGISYNRTFQLAKCYGLTVKRERKERGKSNWKKHFGGPKKCI